MNSGLYECSVMHHRLSPKVHRFRYRIFMFAFDLDEIDAVAARIPFFSRNRPNLDTLRDRDHLTVAGLETASRKEKVVAWLAKQGIAFPNGGRILLVTLPRVLGYIFNPVSFYWCFNPAGEPLCAIAEVGNTFGETKPYLLRDRQGDRGFRLVTPKHFYVSPFSALDLSFDFELRVPGDRLHVRLTDLDRAARVITRSPPRPVAPRPPRHRARRRPAPLGLAVARQAGALAAAGGACGGAPDSGALRWGQVLSVRFHVAADHPRLLPDSPVCALHHGRVRDRHGPGHHL